VGSEEGLVGATVGDEVGMLGMKVGINGINEGSIDGRTVGAADGRPLMVQGQKR